MKAKKLLRNPSGKAFLPALPASLSGMSTHRAARGHRIAPHDEYSSLRTMLPHRAAMCYRIVPGDEHASRGKMSTHRAGERQRAGAPPGGAAAGFAGLMRKAKKAAGLKSPRGGHMEIRIYLSCQRERDFLRRVRISRA